jgi:hypothetical protein
LHDYQHSGGYFRKHSSVGDPTLKGVKIHHPKITRFGEKFFKQHKKKAINTHISQTRGSFSSDGTSLKSTRVCTFVANENKKRERKEKIWAVRTLCCGREFSQLVT